MKLIRYAFLIIIFNSCSQPSENKIQVKTYFDLKAYFEKEAKRLNKLNLKIAKSVAVNGKTENKTLQIADFKNEFSSFINADINKAAWNKEFNITRAKSKIIYSSKNQKIPVKKLEVQYQNNQVASIFIVVDVDNMLYHSTDTLIYKPSISYEIKKRQKIKLLAEKKYAISGKFISDLQPVP